MPLLCDNTSAISIANNPVLHSKTKHIDVRYHFLRDHVDKGDIDLIHVETHHQLADILTKPLDQATFARLWGGAWGLPSFLVGGFIFLVIYVRYLVFVSCFVSYMFKFCIAYVKFCISIILSFSYMPLVFTYALVN